MASLVLSVNIKGVGSFSCERVEYFFFLSFLLLDGRVKFNFFVLSFFVFKVYECITNLYFLTTKIVVFPQIKVNSSVLCEQVLYNLYKKKTSPSPILVSIMLTKYINFKISILLKIHFYLQCTMNNLDRYANNKLQFFVVCKAQNICIFFYLGWSKQKL